MSEEACPHLFLAKQDITPDHSWLTVRCRAMLFYISVSAKDLTGTPFRSEYMHLIGKLYQSTSSEEKDYEAFHDWILSPCESYFQKLTPPVPTKSFTLRGFYKSSFHSYKITVQEGRLYAMPIPAGSSEYTEHMTKATLDSDDLPPYRDVPRFSAADIRLFPNPLKPQDYTIDHRFQVCMRDGRNEYFAPFDELEDIKREINVSERIRCAGLRDKLWVSNVHGIVVSNHGKAVLGLLYDSCPARERTLYSSECRLACEYHAIWEEQVLDTVRHLHELGIVWESVHPGSIVIDEDWNAWVVDFRGGHVEYHDDDGGFHGGFVERELLGTKEGDLSAVKRIFTEWLPSGRNRSDASWVMVPRHRSNTG